MESTRRRGKAQRRLLAADDDTTGEPEDKNKEQEAEEEEDEEEDEDDDEDDDVEAHAHRLNKQVKLLTEESALLEAERDRLEIEKVAILYILFCTE